MTNQPKLLVADASGPVRGIAVVLHGGRSRSHLPVRATNLAVLRMRPFVSSLRRHSRSGLVVAQVRYRVRGWNGAERSPVPDTLWALDQLAARFPDVPVALVGHSMGGRAAMYAAAECFRYAVTKSPEALANARKSVQAVLFLEEVAGRRGFPARTDRRGSGR